MFIKFNTIINTNELTVERLNDDVYIFRPNKEYEKKHISEAALMNVQTYSELEEILKNRNENIADYLLKRV